MQTATARYTINDGFRRALGEVLGPTRLSTPPDATRAIQRALGALNLTGQFTLQGSTITLVGADVVTQQAFTYAVNRGTFFTSPWHGTAGVPTGAKPGAFSWNDAFARAIREVAPQAKWTNAITAAEVLGAVMKHLGLSGMFRVQGSTITLVGPDVVTQQALTYAVNRGTFRPPRR